MATLYTVPTTGTYRTPDGKDVRYYTAGTVIDMTDAVRFGMTGAVIDTPNLFDDSRRGEISSLIQRTPGFPRARGAVCFTWDDGWAEQYAAAQLASVRGQRHTFFATSSLIGTAGYMTAGQLAAVATMGHEVGAHGRTHVDVSAQTAAERVSQYDDSKAALEAIVGAGTVRSWSYPLGGRSDTTDQELWLRYERSFDIGNNSAIGRPYWMIDADNRDGFLWGRMPWGGSTAEQNRVLAAIRLAWREPVIVVIYSHQLDASGSCTTAQATEAMDLCSTLGVPCLTVSEALPGAPPLIDGGFEDANGVGTTSTQGGFCPWIANQDGGSATFGSVLDAPDTALPGVRSGKVSGLSSGNTYWISQCIPIRNPAVPWTVSFRYRVAITSGAGSITARLDHLDYKGGSLAQSNTSALTQTAWTRQTLASTLNASARCLVVSFRVSQLVADLYVDHVHLAPTANGSFG